MVGGATIGDAGDHVLTPSRKSRPPGCRAACGKGAIRIQQTRRPFLDWAMAVYYYVKLSDLRRPIDRIVDRRSSRSGADAICRRRNADLLRRHGGKLRTLDGMPIPVFYVERVDERGKPIP